MTIRPPARAPGPWVALSAALICGLVMFPGTTPAADRAAGSKKNAGAPQKDVVLDGPRAAASTSQARAGTAAVAAPASAAAALPPNLAPTAARQHAAAPAFADLGLHLLRHTVSEGKAPANAVASPYSIAMALGMLHAGAAGTTATEIAGVLEPTVTGGRLLAAGFGDLSASITGNGKSRWMSANRIWVSKKLAPSLSPVFVERLKSGFRADGMASDFAGDAEGTRSAMNGWVAESTQKQITEILPAGSVLPTTRMVMSNAAYFEGQWQTPFEAAKTSLAPFLTAAGSHDVATMHGAIPVREGTIDNIYVLELGFDGGDFGLMLAMPPESHTLQALENDVMGADIAAWSAALKPQRVALALPKFDIQGASVPLDDVLRKAAVKTAFTPQADFSGIAAGAGLYLDNVFHNAAFKVDEKGTTASAATAAIMVAKSAPGMEPLPVREFNRPFVFVLLHKPTGTPLFVGRVVSPQ